MQAAIAAMNLIKGLGSRLAIDDFGTGYSTFASLHDFPAEVLKIDPSLLTGMEESKASAAFVHSLALLVHNLGMTMVAEGVETESIVITFRELGCQYGQGYFLAKPLPPAEFEAFALNRQTPAQPLPRLRRFKTADGNCCKSRCLGLAMERSNKGQ